ncbi:Biopolymer transport protein [Dulcicalothrix desertica PCC 7102]|nr:Biopolymer transport protein [Dulcicalothrix desertica PCC 7102]
MYYSPPETLRERKKSAILSDEYYNWCNIYTLLSQARCLCYKIIMNKLTIIASIISLSLAPLVQENLSQASVQMSEFNLTSHKWKNRILLVFAPTAQNVNYQRQVQLFQQQQQGLNERDLLLVTVLDKGTSYINQQPIDIASAAKLRQKFNINDNDFRVILVGKDGGAKRQDSKVVQAKTIFREIDAMPMRQQEMQRKRE